MKIKEIRTLSAFDLRNLCIRQNWFTKATNPEYDRFLTRTRKRNGDYIHMTADRLLTLALEVQQYSDPETYEGLGLEGIVYSLCKICHSCFTVEE